MRILFILFCIQFIVTPALSQEIKTSLEDSTYFYTQFPNYETWHWFNRDYFKDSVPDGMYYIYYTKEYKKLAYKGSIKNYKKEGEWTYFHENDKVNYVITYKEGKLNGRSTYYTTYGKLIRENNYVNNKKEGIQRDIWRYREVNYYRNTDRFGVYKYSNDSLISSNYWTHDYTVNVTNSYNDKTGIYVSTHKNNFGETLKIEKYKNGKKISDSIYEGKSNETTYRLTVPFNSSKDTVIELMSKLTYYNNLHSLIILNYSKDSTIDSLIQALIHPIENMPNLIEIELRGLGFSKIPPSIFNCKNLQTLTLRELNVFILPREIKKLKKLNFLKLRFMKFNDMEKVIKTISKVASLKELQLTDCFNVLPTNLNLLQQIEALYVGSYTECIKYDPYELNEGLFKLKNLKALEICTQQIYKYKELFAKKMPYCHLLQTPTCFEGNTKIILSDYSQKSISLLKVGDIILAYDTVNRRIDTAKVTEFHHFGNGSYSIIEINLNDTSNTKINCTGNHPFRTGINSWTKASDLKPSDILYLYDSKTNNLKPVTISHIKSGTPISDVYNISTTKKNYFANSVLVHNK